MGTDETGAARPPTAFISHHSSQVETARRLKVILGHHGITGWMAPDDIDPGQPFDKAIVDQVRRSDLIILLFCAQSDQSRHVKRELMMAEDADKLIYPVRLEEKAAEGLAYWLNDYQWIDWFDGNDDTITRMIETIKRQAEGSGAASPETAAMPSVPSPVSGSNPEQIAAVPAGNDAARQWTVPVVTAVIVALVMLGGFYIMTRDDGGDASVQTAAAEAEADEVVGEVRDDEGRASPDGSDDAATPPAPELEPAPAGGGYYIVIGSFQPGDEAALRRARAFENCAGIAPIIGRSDDYAGFAPGLTVVMTGGYRNAGEANRALAEAQDCVVDAYIRSTGG